MLPLTSLRLGVGQTLNWPPGRNLNFKSESRLRPGRTSESTEGSHLTSDGAGFQGHHLRHRTDPSRTLSSGVNAHTYMQNPSQSNTL